MSSALILFAAILNLADLRQAVWNDFSDGATFSLTCTVVRVSRSVGTQGPVRTGYILSDGTGSVSSGTTNNLPAVRPADLVSVSGHVGIERNGWPRTYIDAIRVIGRGNLSAPVRITALQLSDERLDARAVVLKGIVYSINPDEADPRQSFITFRSPEGPFMAMIETKLLSRHPMLKPSAEVAIRGFARIFPQGGKRQFQNAMLDIDPNGIQILKAPPANPFAVPGIRQVSHMSAAAVSNMNMRKAVGIVIARLRDSTTVLRTADHRIVKVIHADGRTPACGETVEAVGFPETDFFSLILSHATCRPTAAKIDDDNPLPIHSTSALIIHDDAGVRYQAEHHGRLVRLCGFVENARRPEGHVITLVAGREAFTLDLTSCPALADDLESGTEIELTGIFLLETDPWTTAHINPRVRGATLVPRSPHDVRILKAAPWWTAKRLLVVVSALLAAVIGMLIWNSFLQRLVERRGRQLFKAEIAQAKADLRVEDRTRLAADIHDSVAQTLTGVGFQIDAAAKALAKDNQSASAAFLAIAKRTLLSCREELRRCLWDLRSHSLEEHDLASAIRETIHPVVGTTAVTIQFNVPRARLSDTTTHALLCIVRELVANAVRHGQSRHIRIIGEYRNEHLRFSVTDDGCGFDSNHPAGPTQGHFGLQGVRERLIKLGGTLTIESTPGTGTHVIVEIGK